MDGIQGTYREGRIDLDSSVTWPEGMRVEVAPLGKLDEPRDSDPSEPGVEDVWGMDEADYQDTPEFRASLIAQLDAFEPLELTAEEEAEWEAARKWIKDHTLAAVGRQMGLEA